MGTVSGYKSLVLQTLNKLGIVPKVCNKGRCGTVSKALLTSKNTAQTSWPWSRALEHSSTTLISADVVERDDMKPHCLSEIGALYVVGEFQ